MSKKKNSGTVFIERNVKWHHKYFSQKFHWNSIDAFDLKLFISD